MKKRYVFRAASTPAGFLAETELHMRVLAALEDTLASGIPVTFDSLALATDHDMRGEKVTIDLEWGDGVGFGEARQYLDRHALTVED